MYYKVRQLAHKSINICAVVHFVIPRTNGAAFSIEKVQAMCQASLGSILDEDNGFFCSPLHPD